MSKSFQVRLVTPADAGIIGSHRARMFRDMGDIPPHLFDKFYAMSRERLHEQLTSGEYIGWLATPSDSLDQIIGGAGVQLRRVMPHPLTSPDGEPGIAEDRHAIIVNVFTEPDWRRCGIAAFLMQHVSIGRGKCNSIASFCTPPMKVAFSTDNSASLQPPKWNFPEQFRSGHAESRLDSTHQRARSKPDEATASF